jgi:hypothetical protein
MDKPIAFTVAEFVAERDAHPERFGSRLDSQSGIVFTYTRPDGIVQPLLLTFPIKQVAPIK